MCLPARIAGGACSFFALFLMGIAMEKNRGL